MSRLITFRVGPSRYALPAEIVSEVVATGPIVHRLPGPAGDKVALVCVRDRWIPVMELEAVLPEGGRVEPDAAESLLLVIGEGATRIALRVAELGGVADLGEGGGEGSEELVDIGGEWVRRLDPGIVLPLMDVAREEGKTMQAKDADGPIELITFEVGGEEFGFDVMRVSRVVKVPEIRKVPRAPDFVEGVVALQESALPVIDLRKRFSVPVTSGPGTSRLLVVQVGEHRLGLLVDEVPGVVRLSPEAISPAPDFFKGLAGRYLHGIGQRDDRVIILLNLDELLSSDERIALGKMIDTAAASSGSGTGAAGGRKRRSRKGRRKKADSS